MFPTAHTQHAASTIVHRHDALAQNEHQVSGFQPTGYCSPQSPSQLELPPTRSRPPRSLSLSHTHTLTHSLSLSHTHTHAPTHPSAPTVTVDCFPRPTFLRIPLSSNARHSPERSTQVGSRRFDRVCACTTRTRTYTHVHIPGSCKMQTRSYMRGGLPARCLLASFH